MQESFDAHPPSGEPRRGERAGATFARLVGIYNADGSVVGELRYFVAKTTGSSSCALCDLTHGRFRRRSEFTACAESLPIPFELLHRDNQPIELRAVTEGHLPCIVGIGDDGSATIVVDPAAIGACGKDVAKLRALLDQVVVGNSR